MKIIITNDFQEQIYYLFCIKFNFTMKEDFENIEEETKNYIFEELKDCHEYWGSNSLLEMIDFCNRNNLPQKKALLLLMKPNRIKG